VITVGNLRRWRSVGRWAYRIVAGAALALVLAALSILIVIPRATHGVALTVLTGSMTPGIPVGSVVIDRPVDPGTLKVGDVATYQKGGPGNAEYITHRIVAIDTSTSPTTFTFKGDANRGADIDPVPASMVRGKVWFHVPYLGTIRDFLSTPTGRVAIVGVVAAMLAGYSIRQFAEALRERKAKKGGPASAAMSLDFDLDAFGEVDPSFVARLLKGECELLPTGGVRISFAGDDQRLGVLREVLEPFARTTADQEPVGAAASGQVEQLDLFAALGSLGTGTPGTGESDRSAACPDQAADRTREALHV
jgi:signal peptidase